MPNDVTLVGLHRCWPGREIQVCDVCLGGRRDKPFYAFANNSVCCEECLTDAGFDALSVHQYANTIREKRASETRAHRFTSLDLGPGTLDWIRQIAERPEAQTDYEAALVLLWREGWVAEADRPITDKAAEMYERALLKLQIKEEKKALADTLATGSWLGTVGGAQDIGLLTCHKLVELTAGEYGPRWLVVFTGPAGEAVVWFTGEGGKFDPKPGETYDVRAGVKEHGVYEGVRQTVITRAAERKEPKAKAKKEKVAP